MGVPIMILGESGTGKSASMRNLSPGNVGIFNVSGKPLPFRNPQMAARCKNSDNMLEIRNNITTAASPILIIDDAQYLMANEYMRKANVTGFQKFTDIQKAFWDIVQTVITLPDEKTVYFLMHIDRDSNGYEKAKTIGKLLDEKITLEGMFSIVLKTVVQNGDYLFSTRNSGQDTVKTPLDMFADALIPNDLAAVDKVIREYYGMALEAKKKTTEKPQEKATA